MTLPLVPRSICLQLLWVGLLLGIVVHPWVCYALWFAALAVLLQEFIVYPVVLAWGLLDVLLRRCGGGSS